MTTARAQRLLLDRLSSGATALLSIHLALREVPDWSDGRDADGRAVLLVGTHQLGKSGNALAAVESVLASLLRGEVPEGVHAVVYAPAASALIAETVAGQSAEVLGDGPRGSGKTQALPAALAILAELHSRARHPLPLRVVWLHDSLTNAAIKTGRSLEQPLWGGLWSLRDDRRVAALTVAGAELVAADFVGTRDETAAERLRAECHVVAAEELVASLDEAGGIEERKYELALTSMRLPTRRRVAVSVTNPGDVDSWPFKRWIEGGGRPGCARVQVPASDRLTTGEVAALRAAFRESPDLEKRLALGEWAALVVGEVVAVGFRPELHVAPKRLDVAPGVPLLFGHDAGLTPVTVVGQEIRGEVRVLAALVSDRAGTRQHLESLVQPWLAVRAPEAMRSGLTLVHFCDPAMDVPVQSDIEESPISVLRQVLPGMTCLGATLWPARRDPLLTLLNRLISGRPALQICPVGGQPLIRALSGRWHYPTVNGVTSRELPLKNHPASDLGDALCYLVGGIMPARAVSRPKERPARPTNTAEAWMGM